MTIGIYCIQFNLHDNWYPTYVGQSINIEKRKKDHFNSLATNSHKNYLLQNLYNIYGKTSLEFNILETCEIDFLTIKELEYAYAFGYPDKTLCLNIAEPGGFCLYHTSITKNKIKIAQQGEKGNNAILTEEEARFILTALSFPLSERKYTYEALSQYFNVSPKTIENIKSKARWKHIKVFSLEEFKEYDKKYDIPIFSRPTGIAKNFTKEDIINIRNLAIKGETQLSIANKYNVSKKAIYRIIHRETYKHID